MTSRQNSGAGLTACTPAPGFRCYLRGRIDYAMAFVDDDEPARTVFVYPYLLRRPGRKVSKMILHVRSQIYLEIVAENSIQSPVEIEMDARR